MARTSPLLSHSTVMVSGSKLLGTGGRPRTHCGPCQCGHECPVYADGAIFIVEMAVNPDAVRRGRAESDVVVGEIMKKPVSLDAALRERAREIVSGTISVEFETDPAGNVRRRTKVTKLDIKGPDGRSETQTVTETLERRLISRRD
jgi:hypothetical protein